MKAVRKGAATCRQAPYKGGHPRPGHLQGWSHAASVVYKGNRLQGRCLRAWRLPARLVVPPKGSSNCHKISCLWAGQPLAMLPTQGWQRPLEGGGRTRVSFR
ncbi:hypothetical protein BHM03_00051123 [Ensete ventricosum]|nr:hypothetical protein BHM03_00051123 [Ensete ventricosum]